MALPFPGPTSSTSTTPSDGSGTNTCTARPWWGAPPSGDWTEAVIAAASGTDIADTVDDARASTAASSRPGIVSFDARESFHIHKAAQILGPATMGSGGQ